jgi:putative tryptophan/tyrosine transport system substrate-binding protein
MRRRQFIAALGAAAAWPRRLSAEPALPVIGLLGSERDARFPAFHQGLAEAGYTEGRNVTIQYRWAQGHVERYPELAADLVRRDVTVIAALGGSPAATAAKSATATIPVVFQGSLDPVEIGLVASLSRPGGNLTGVTNLGLELGPKRLEVMHELKPTAKAFALLINPDHPRTESQARTMQAAARALGLEVRMVPASTVQDFDSAFAGLARLDVDGIVIATGQPLVSRGRQLGILAARYAVPAIHESREFVAAGGLASYSGSREDAYRLAGAYVGRILRGEKPADLPVQQVTKVELVINLKAAKALGLSVPLSLLGRADEVIE